MVGKLTPEEEKIYKMMRDFMHALIFGPVPEGEKRALAEFMNGPPPKTIMGIKPYIPHNNPIKPLKLDP